MTLGDLILRLTEIRKEKFASAIMQPQVIIGKNYNDYNDCFQYFDIKVDGTNIVFVPSDKWDRKEHK
jgi:hypothetical protein